MSDITLPKAFECVGWRQVETGELMSLDEAEELELDFRWWRPVYAGGPELVAPLLEALIKLADARAEGADQRSNAFLSHRFDAQRALGEFVDMGGEIP